MDKRPMADSIEVSRVANGFVARKHVLDYKLAEVFCFTDMNALLGWIRTQLEDRSPKRSDEQQRVLFFTGKQGRRR